MVLRDQELESRKRVDIVKAEEEGKQRIADVLQRIRSDHPESFSTPTKEKSQDVSPMYPTTKKPVDYVPMGGAQDD